MRMAVYQSGIYIIPENAKDHVYLEKGLGLKKDKDKVKAVRHNVKALSSVPYYSCYIEIKSSKSAKGGK